MSPRIKIQKHTHKLKRHRYNNGEDIYFCTLNCGFRILCRLALGLEVQCNRCDKAFVMNEYSITLGKPHCTDCHKHKNPIVSIDDLGILPEAQPTMGAIKVPEPTLKRIEVANDAHSLRERLKKSIGETLAENQDDLL